MKTTATKHMKHENSFPALYVCTGHYNKGMIVLMSECGTGMVVHSTEDSGHMVGKYFTTWDEQMFEPYDDMVTIKN